MLKRGDQQPTPANFNFPTANNSLASKIHGQLRNQWAQPSRPCMRVLFRPLSLHFSRFQANANYAAWHLKFGLRSFIVLFRVHQAWDFNGLENRQTNIPIFAHTRHMHGKKWWWWHLGGERSWEGLKCLRTYRFLMGKCSQKNVHRKLEKKFKIIFWFWQFLRPIAVRQKGVSQCYSLRSPIFFKPISVLRFQFQFGLLFFKSQHHCAFNNPQCQMLFRFFFPYVKLQTSKATFRKATPSFLN